ncbi:hypothetical protein SAMN05443572_111236 [Myxococcus fulvus]|uniref:Uncharacterized protein n=1 Tax=Myxococcus fulvus TaxID=33 RepID=A0A511TD40_MYXFU|nr:hypothetical protein MFU01_71360 [Myxococcus fulvus]SEU36596.1 hypothetical protein SAMN05443572_111236 [Myxococcus fulvus]
MPKDNAVPAVRLCVATWLSIIVSALVFATAVLNGVPRTAHAEEDSTLEASLAPVFESAHGVTVHAVRAVDDRLLELAIAGTWDGDLLERVPAAATARFHQALDNAGFEHHYAMHGRPQPGENPLGCERGHNIHCWSYTFSDVLPRMLSVLAGP